jgi:hypothetical protein
MAKQIKIPEGIVSEKQGRNAYDLRSGKQELPA